MPKIETYTVEVSRGPRLDVTIRPAVMSDITGIKQIADRNKDALGFVRSGALLRAVERGFVVVAEADGQVVGFCEFYLYKDGTQVTIYTLATTAAWRKLGIARRLVYTVCELAPLTQLKCVADLPANKFYHDLVGFTCVRREAGKRRELNVWQYRQCQCGRCQREPTGWPAGMCHWCGGDIGRDPIGDMDDEAICDECWHEEYGDSEDEGEEDDGENE